MKLGRLLLGLTSAFLSHLQAAPLTFNTALPVSKGEYIFREQLIVVQSGNDSSGLNRERTEINLASTWVYGLNPDVALFISIPYTNRRLETLNNESRQSRGIGDARVFARYTVYQNDFQGGSFRVAPFVGIKLPNGEDDQRDTLGQLPRSVQSGTGSWDLFGGLVATYGTVDWEVDGQLSFQENTEAHAFETGDRVRADVSFQYRLFPAKLVADTNHFINGVLEANLIYMNNNRLAGVSDENSGGTTLFLVPGLQYVAERYIAEISVQIPVVQNLKGVALESDYIFRTGMRFNF